MDNEKIAEELVKIAKELTAKELVAGSLKDEDIPKKLDEYLTDFSKKSEAVYAWKKSDSLRGLHRSVFVLETFIERNPDHKNIKLLNNGLRNLNNMLRELTKAMDQVDNAFMGGTTPKTFMKLLQNLKKAM